MDGDNSSNKYPIKVVREQPILKGRNFIQNINEATDLFGKFSKSHRVNRLHCDFEELSEEHKKKLRDLADSL